MEDGRHRKIGHITVWEYRRRLRPDSDYGKSGRPGDGRRVQATRGNSV